MRVALVAPSGVPFVVGGAEKLWWGLTQHVNRLTDHAMELIKLPSPERNFWEIAHSYAQFSALDLSHFDAVISTKYPAWMVDHPNHVVYLQHRLRGLYDTCPPGLSAAPRHLPAGVQALWQLVTSASSTRQMLPEIFGRIDALRTGRGLDPERLEALTALPGPLIRAVVHKLDQIALQPRAISRYFAISRVVAERKDYFPPGVPVEVVPHPSNLDGLHEGPAEFVFTASRLDAPKRIDLLIRAYRRCRTDVPLWIAGDGPQAGPLRALAGDDARIRFLGRLTDEELVDHYSRAALVPFVPELEDMGLITLEAMASGKAVLSVTDAGGVTEFVQDGVNGRIVAPDERALARALDDMLSDRAALTAMGEAARQTAAAVTWDRTAQALLTAAAQGASANPPAAARPASPAGPAAWPHTTDLSAPPPPKPLLRLLVVNTFGVFPPDSGGKKRMFFLYRGMAKWADVTLLNLGAPGSQSEVREFDARYREVRIPPDETFLKREAALAQRLHRPVTDISALLYFDHLAAFREAFVRLAKDADVVVAAHVYFAPMIDALWSGPVWYDAHNVEADMKADVLGIAHPAAPLKTVAAVAMDLQCPEPAQRAVDLVAAAESKLVTTARRVLAVSDINRQRLAALYGRAPDTMELAPNGTHLPEDAWLDGPRRGALKASLGFGDSPLAVFVASYHGPNLEAAQAVLDMARLCPGWHFGVAGSVCNDLARRELPRNVHALGVVTEAELTVLLRAADVGLNPMKTGSGTNLKLLDYTGHGALVVTTPVGARGLDFTAGAHYLECGLAEFPAVLNGLSGQVPGPHPALRAAARAITETVYEWDAIAAALAD
jgi:glycosyltransferase involved in cell wall biosynthesis